MIVSLLILLVVSLVFIAGFFVASHARSELAAGRRFFIVGKHAAIVLVLALVAWYMHLPLLGIGLFAVVLAVHFIVRKEQVTVMILAIVFAMSSGNALIVASALICLYLLMLAALLTEEAVQKKWTQKDLALKAILFYVLFIAVSIIGLIIESIL